DPAGRARAGAPGLVAAVCASGQFESAGLLAHGRRLLLARRPAAVNRASPQRQARASGTAPETVPLTLAWRCGLVGSHLINDRDMNVTIRNSVGPSSTVSTTLRQPSRA